jgi:RHS repeat-associated protein
MAYRYDAENRLISAGSYSYVYDAEGRRVAKKLSGTTVNEYLLDAGGAQLIELDGAGNAQHTNIFANGSLIATYKNSDNQTYFHFSDWLGNRRYQVTAGGDTLHAQTCTNLPFGDDLSCTGGSDTTEHHFTGKEHDSESSLDYFGARYYESGIGRFGSPDPALIKTSRVLNPQRFDMYVYAVNNPLTNIDPDGRDAIAVAFQESYYHGMGAILGNKVWSLGHAGLVTIDSKGHTAYYDKNGAGVHKEDLGTHAVDENGKLSPKETATILQQLSKEHGEGGEVKAGYFKADDKSVAQMNKDADARASSDEDYKGTKANCAQFVEDELRAASLPSSSSVTPNGMMMDIQSQGATPLDLKNDSDAARNQLVKDLEKTSVEPE